MGGQVRHPTTIPNPPDSNHHTDSIQYSSFVCPNCKERKWHNRVASRHCGRKSLGGIFLIAVPTLAWVLLTTHWFVICKQALEELEGSKRNFQEKTIQAGKLILSLNLERELTATYLTARSEESRNEAKYDLGMARSKTDEILNSFYAWPGIFFEQQQREQDQLWRLLNATSSTGGPAQSQSLFRSRHLFLAFLNGHRAQIQSWSYFCDEIQFYTDLIDAILVWINRGDSPFSLSFPPSAASILPSFISLSIDFGKQQEDADYIRHLLQSHSYLMTSLNYLGAEQALCTVYHSIVCLSRRETLYYANFSFAAEAFFRFYRQSFPATRHDTKPAPSQNQWFDEGTASFDNFFPSSSTSSSWRWTGPGIPKEWRTADHRLFFPSLHTCRRELVTEMDYLLMTGGAANDAPSPQQDGKDGDTANKPKGSSNPSESGNVPCGYTRKNETKLFDTDLVTDHELNRVLSTLKIVVESVDKKTKHSRNMATMLLISTCLYLSLIHFIRCIYSTITASKKHKRASKARSILLRREQESESSTGGTGSAPLLLVMKQRDSLQKPEVYSNQYQGQQRQSSLTTFDDEFVYSATSPISNNLSHRPNNFSQKSNETLRKPDHSKHVRIQESTLPRHQPMNKITQLQQTTLPNFLPLESRHPQAYSLLQSIRETEQRSIQQSQQQTFSPTIQLQMSLHNPSQSNAQSPPTLPTSTTATMTTTTNDSLDPTSINNFVVGYKIATV